jgi:mevalonate kinase
MDIIEVKSPGVIKLFGEHAVVYGKLSIAAAINLYAVTKVYKSDIKNISLKLKDLDKSINVSKEDLSSIYKNYLYYLDKGDIRGFVDSELKFDKSLLPFLVIASRIQEEFKGDISGATISLKSDIPIGKGCASSAACSSSFAIALLNFANLKLEDSTIIDLIRDGERVVHLNKNAGAIDVSTSVYGGYVSFSAVKGAVPIKSNAKLNLVLIDTGPKKSTAETVGHIRDLYNKDKEGTLSELDLIEKYSNEGLDILSKDNIDNKDLVELGKLMYENQIILKRLGVSTSALDDAIEKCRSAGFYGAKLSGGGGGGIAIGLVDKNIKQIKIGTLNIINTEASDFGSFEFYKFKNHLKSRDR